MHVCVLLSHETVRSTHQKHRHKHQYHSCKLVFSRVYSVYPLGYIPGYQTSLIWPYSSKYPSIPWGCTWVPLVRYVPGQSHLQNTPFASWSLENVPEYPSGTYPDTLGGVPGYSSGIYAQVALGMYPGSPRVYALQSTPLDSCSETLPSAVAISPFERPGVGAEDAEARAVLDEVSHLFQGGDKKPRRTC